MALGTGAGTAAVQGMDQEAGYGGETGWTAIGREARMGAGAGAAWPAELPAPAMRIMPDMRPTLLVVAPGGRAAMLAGWAERAGLRCVGCVTLDQAAERLALMSALDLILVDLRDDSGKSGPPLGQSAARALAARHGLPQARLAVLTDLAGVDCAMAWLDAPGTDMLCEPESSDIVSLLVMAALQAERSAGQPVFNDISGESDTARIEKLSDEVRRLAATIERLALDPGLIRGGESVMDRRGDYRGPDCEMGPEARFRPRERRLPGKGLAGAPSHGEIRALLRARRLRDQYLPADLFADPAWDMILDLMAARLSGQRVSVSSLCIAASVPPTTALRWIRQLTERGVFARIDDPADGRRVFIELSDEAAGAVSNWTEVVRRSGGLLASAAAGAMS